MAELKYSPVPHDQKAFLAIASGRKGFNEAYEALAVEYKVEGQMLKALTQTGLSTEPDAQTDRSSGSS